MILKRILSICLITSLLSLFIALSCSAHSGRTDSKGGHYNHGTGEYHYHHGTSAHQHYDINNDGVIDCPREYSGKIIIRIIGVILLVITVYLVIFTCIDKRKEKIKKAEEKRKFLEEKLLMTEKYGGKPISYFVSMPDNSEIGTDNLPKEKGNHQYWGEQYTVFVTYNGNKYHKRSCRHATYAHPKNIYTVKRFYSPCALCNPTLPDLKWVDEYFKIKKIKEKYEIDRDEDDPYIKINYREK